MFDGDTNEPEVSPEFLSTAEVWDELSKEVDTLISVTGLSHDVALMVMHVLRSLFLCIFSGTRLS